MGNLNFHSARSGGKRRKLLTFVSEASRCEISRLAAANCELETIPEVSSCSDSPMSPGTCECST